MRNYDFRSLSDKDFEILVCDLLSAEHGIRFERFKPGKDGGIDGRYFSDAGGQVILQCKHWVRSTIPALIRSLKSTELPKVTKLCPKRYLVATSLELSPANKKAIKDVMSPFIVSESDIFGAEDLNDLLGRHEVIERQHYKLWLSGTNVLQTILHNAILGRSDFAVKEILDKSSKYVTTTIHEQAEKKLADLNVVIITGEPGVGKTTLAEQLCIQYVNNGFQLIVIGDKIEEAEAVIVEGVPQIFYFDDFLGRNYLSALNRHEDTHIVSFIKRITKDKLKRFVLTSRTNVLNQGKRIADTFFIAKLDRNELEVRVSSLKPYEKAELLYNHVWFAELEINYVEQILMDKRYRKIIEHRNFNPRLISFVTDPQRLSEVTAENYWDYIQDKLNNPTDIWEHTYESQLDDFSRAIVLIVVLNGGDILETALRDAYYRLLGYPFASNYSGIADFNSNIRTLTGSLLNRNIESNNDVSLTLFNPSVADYVVNRIKGDSQLIEAIFLATASEDALANLNALAEESLFGFTAVKKCLVRLAKLHLPNSSTDLTPHYKMVLSEKVLSFAKDNRQILELVASFLRTLTNEDAQLQNNWRLLGALMEILLTEKMISEDDAWRLLAWVQLDECDDLDLEALAPTCHFFSGHRKEEFTENLRQAVLSYWDEYITQEIQELDILCDCWDSHDFSFGREKALEAICDLLGKYPLPFSEADIQLIANSCDVEQIISDNVERATNAYEGDGYRGHGTTPSDDRIDDLFIVDLPS